MAIITFIKTEILQSSDTRVKRSLIQEFVNHDESCQLASNGVPNLSKSLLSLLDLRQSLDNNFTSGTNNFVKRKNTVAAMNVKLECLVKLRLLCR